MEKWWPGTWEDAIQSLKSGKALWWLSPASRHASFPVVKDQSQKRCFTMLYLYNLPLLWQIAYIVLLVCKIWVTQKAISHFMHFFFINNTVLLYLYLCNCETEQRASVISQGGRHCVTSLLHRSGIPSPASAARRWRGGGSSDIATPRCWSTGWAAPWQPQPDLDPWQPAPYHGNIRESHWVRERKRDMLADQERERQRQADRDWERERLWDSKWKWEGEKMKK